MSNDMKNYKKLLEEIELKEYEDDEETGSESTEAEDRLTRVLKKAEEYRQKQQSGPSTSELRSGGFWISPEGQILKLKGGKYHIHMIVDDPEMFGLTQKDVEQEYDETGENIGQEGSARIGLIEKALQNGWIHVRKYKEHYAINVWDINFQISDRIEEFGRELTEDGISGEFANMNDEFVVYSLKRDKRRKATIKQILRGGLMEAEEHDYHPDGLMFE